MKHYHCSARLEDERFRLLVIMRAGSFGNKGFLGVSDGYRKSTQSWKRFFGAKYPKAVECFAKDKDDLFR